MVITPLSQRDDRWKDVPVGTGTQTIGQVGCTLTCVTMLINVLTGKNITPDVLNQQLKDNGGYVFDNLLVWGAVTKLYPQVKFQYRQDGYKNIPVLYSVLRGVPVVVQVNAAKIGARQHWCLFVGGQKMVDPWTGLIVPTSTYPALGYALYSK